MNKNVRSTSVDADELWKVAWTYIRTIVDTVREPFLVLDKDLVVLSANKTFYSFFQVRKEETEGKKVYDLGNGQWNIPVLKILLEDILPKNTHLEDFAVTHMFPRIGHKHVLLNARQIFTPHTEEPILLLAIEDITKQTELQERMREYTKELAEEVAKRTVELEDRIKELERVNKTMVDRELKMMELKKEIKSLKKEKTYHSY